MTTRPTRSSAACATALTALVTPGPLPTTSTPGASRSSASAQAMKPAPVSVWASTQSIPAAANASIRSRLLPPPGNPYARRTPAARSRPASSALTVVGLMAGSVKKSNDYGLRRVSPHHDRCAHAHRDAPVAARRARAARPHRHVVAAAPLHRGDRPRVSLHLLRH